MCKTQIKLLFLHKIRVGSGTKEKYFLNLHLNLIKEFSLYTLSNFLYTLGSVPVKIHHEGADITN